MKRLFLIACFLPLFAASQGIITTIAGSGVTGYAGDGTPATAAALNNPDGILMDISGNVYIGDQANNRIRKINTAGIITTVAGNGLPGYSGDGGVATAAELNAPIDMVFDNAGNMLVVEYLNNTVRKINSSGIISAIAGTGTAGYSGDGGQATDAQLNGAEGICVDIAGNIYIADGHNQCIRKINTSGIITTIAGTGTRGYNGDGIAATAAQLNDPFGIAMDSVGNLFIADQDNHRIRRINAAGIISTVAGTGTGGNTGDGGPATAAELNDPTDVFYDAAHAWLYIADKLSGCVRKVDASGTISTAAGTGISGYSGDGGPATAANLNWPSFVFVNATGTLLISDYLNNRIRLVANCATILSQPVSDTVFEGADAVYTVTSSIPSVGYQWQEDPGTGFVDLANVWPYSGVTTSALTIHNTSTFLNTTHYRCILNYSGYCTDTSSSAILIVRNTTGLKQVTDELVNIYPNPTTGIVSVILPQGSNGRTIQLINEIGQTICRQKSVNNVTHFDLSLLPAGMYIIKVSLDQEILYKKVFRN